MNLKTKIGVLGLYCFNQIAFANSEVVIYSARKTQLIQPILDKFTTETGIKTKLMTGEAPALIERIKAEGANSPADILMTVDVGNLWQAKNEKLLEPIKSKVLENHIPAHLRSQDQDWFGLSLRARTIIFNKDKVKDSDLTTYEALADAKWNKKLCLRTSKKVYNQSMVAMMIEHQGAEKTESMIKGWVKNLAAPVFGSDNDVIKAVESGQCEVGIVNTYYLGSYHKDNANSKVAVYWPNQKAQGVHVNISGAALVKTAKSKENAIKLMEWLASPKGQEMFASINMEYPVSKEVKPATEIAKWGDFKEDKTNLIKAGSNQAEAIRIMDKAGYL